jgi:hypothetical protein
MSKASLTFAGYQTAQMLAPEFPVYEHGYHGIGSKTNLGQQSWMLPSQPTPLIVSILHRDEV